MTTTVDQLLDQITSHRCYNHPIFKHWGDVNPDAEAVGALFHQIQLFCASTRPGGNYLEAMKTHGLMIENQHQHAIVESEENHGPELATMAGHIVNKAAKRAICSDVYNQQAVENTLKECSDKLLGKLPGYDQSTGLALQTRKAIAVLNRREATDYESTIKNIGTTLALEKISNCQLIPGEKHCLIDSKLYDTDMNAPEMHYLLEHYGEIGAEQEHEKYAIEMTRSALNDKTAPYIQEGIHDFLESLANLWDLLDAAILHSGYKASTSVAH
jgi:hypothetical protein